MSTARRPDLAHVLFGKTRRAVLALFFTRPDENFHLRQVVRLTDAGVGAVQRELATLSEHGILLRKAVGNQILYRVNRHSPIFDELQSIIIKTAGVGDVLRVALVPVEDRIRFAFLFGSVARREQNRQSDVDVMIISDDLQLADVTPALRDAERTIGRAVNPILYRTSEFRAKVASGQAFLRRVLQQPKVFLMGDEREFERLAEERLAAPSSGKRR